MSNERLRLLSSLVLLAAVAIAVVILLVAGNQGLARILFFLVLVVGYAAILVRWLQLR